MAKEKIPFVFITRQSWFVDIGSNGRNLSLELSKEHPILYIIPPMDSASVSIKGNKNAFQKQLELRKNGGDKLQKVAENIWVFYPTCVLTSINWISIAAIHDFLNKKNNIAFAKEIKEGLDKLGWKKFYIFNDNEIMRSIHMKELLNPERYIYYSRDYLVGMPYWQKHGTRLEPIHNAIADVVVGNSPMLAEYAKPFNKHSYYIGQGCDVSHFIKAHTLPVPEQMKAITKPIIGYVGAMVSFRLDINLLIKLADSFPNAELVLVGHEDDDFKKSALHDRKNVTFIPNQPEATLPAFIQAFDVCINPQLFNPITECNYPRKIDEYLAVGKHIVATYTPTMDEIFVDSCLLAKNTEEWVAHIAYALGNKPTEEISNAKRNLAMSHTWAYNVELLHKAISLSYNPEAGELNLTKG